MSTRARAVLVLTVLAALGVGAFPTVATASYGSVPAAAAKTKRCKKGQVRVRVGKRTTCRPLKQVMPKPAAGDPRLLFSKYVVKKDWSQLRNRRRKRAPSLPKLMRKAGPRAPALFNKALARGLARLDAMESGAAVARARAAQSTAGCASANQNGLKKSDSFTSSSGGSKATVSVDLDGAGSSMGIEVSGGEYTVKADVDMGLCDPNEVEAPPCPTAVGKLEGQIRYKLKMSIQVTKGGVNVWSQGAEVTRRTKLTGWNEVDAKLDSLDVEDVETSTFSLGGGATHGFPPFSIKTKINRRTTVDMHSGSFDAGNTQLDVRIDMEGLYGPDRDEAETDAERRARADADKQWRAVIQKAMDGYRSREEKWQNPTCAQLRFTAAPNSTTLHGGDSGSFRGTAIANSDGQPSELDARLTGTDNAIFEPTRAGGQTANFTYRNVAPATAAGMKAVATIRATSKAGVAEGRWEQPIAPPFEIDQIAGNFSGSYSQPVGDRTGVISWTGSGTFVRQTPAGFPGAAGQYLIKAGQVSIHYSGGSIVGDALCDMSGTTFVDLFQHAGGSIGVNPLDLTRPFEQGPQQYGALVTLGFGPTVDLAESSCASSSHNGTIHSGYPVGALPVLDTGPDQLVSPDGIAYNGHRSQNNAGIVTEWTWAMTGSKKAP